MAAGQGFKTFTTGEVLTAGDVNGYLMQGINVFTNATARDAAITAPAEGQFAFTKDNNSLWYYDGAAWVASGATGDIEGVTAGVGISGGGTSGTVTVTNSMATAIDAKGDLVPGTGADTFSRLAVGANGTVLTADSAEATGLKWATASSGGMTLLATVTASAATSVSFTSISQSYKHLFLTWEGVFSSVNDTAYWTVRLNNDSGGNYFWNGTRFGQVSVGEFSQSAFGNGAENAPILGGANIVDAGYSNYGSMWIRDYTDAARGTGVDWRSMSATNGTVARYCQFIGTYADTTAISRVDFIRNSTQTVTGTIRLYGVS